MEPRDRPDDEIEVTPAMIEAGKAAFVAWLELACEDYAFASSPSEESIRVLASSIFSSMMASSLDEAKNVLTSSFSL